VKGRSLTWPRRRWRRPTWRALRGGRRSPPSRGPDVGGGARRWGDKDWSGTKWRRRWQSKRAFELGFGTGRGWGFSCCLVRGSELLEPGPWRWGNWGRDGEWTSRAPSFKGLFSSQKILGNTTVAISLLFDKYYSIMV
jgi:hypothetical protein